MGSQFGQQSGAPLPNSGKDYPAEPLTAVEAAGLLGACSLRVPLSVHAPVQEATSAALPNNTYSGGTLTAASNGALTVDGIAVSLGDRVLVKNEATGANNGIYTCTSPGGVSAKYILTRASDMTSGSQVPGAFCFVEQGTPGGATGWIVANTGPYAIGSTAISWVKFVAAPAIAQVVPTAVKTSVYTASAGDFVLCDTGTVGAFTVTLPTAPANLTVIGVKLVKQAGTNTVTVAAGGWGTFNDDGTTTATLSLLNQAGIWQYDAALTAWIRVSGDLPLHSVVSVSLPAGRAAPPVHWDNTMNGGGSVNLSVGGSMPSVVASNTQGYSNIAFGAGWQGSNPHNGNLGSVTTGYNNTAIGDGALVSETTGHDNAAVGNDCIPAQIGGVANTAVGSAAGLLLSGGSNNTMIGTGALGNTATAVQSNTAVGNAALSGTLTTSFNTAVGATALQSATTGQNDAFGSGALNACTTGSGNFAAGRSSLHFLTTANYNTVVGALAANEVTGAQNTAVGYAALEGASGSTAHDNTAVGWGAMIAVTTAYSNVAVGETALGALTAGYRNVATGYNAGAAVTTGNSVTCLGYNAGNTDGTTVSGTAISSATLIGESAQSQISNVIVLGKGVATRPNLYFGLAPTADQCGGGLGCFFIANAATNPSSNPAGGGVLYVSSGALIYRGSSGTVTTLGPA